MPPARPAELSPILAHYAKAFDQKTVKEHVRTPDVLTDHFSLTPAQVVAEPQFWGRELGMCWERLVRELFMHHVPGTEGPLSRHCVQFRQPPPSG